MPRAGLIWWLVGLIALLLLRAGHSLIGWPLLALVAIVALRRRSSGPRAGGHPFPAPSRRTEILLLTAIVALGAALRVYGLASFPPACWVDEAENGLETGRILAGEFIVFTPRHDGRGALHFYWAAPILAVLGSSPYALRLASAAAGILTLPAAWLLYRRLAGPSMALLAAGFLAISQWHVTVSRVGFDVILWPLFDALAVYALVRGWQEGTRAWFIAAGVLVGLANYGYTAARLSPALMAIGILVLARWSALPSHLLRARRRSGLLLAAAAFVVTLTPLALHAAADPQIFFKRTRNVSIFKQVWETGGSVRPLLLSLRDSLRMFHERGDPNPRHHVPGTPMLDPVTGLMFLAGLLEAWRRRRDEEPAPAMMLGWFALIWVFGGVLTNDGPHANRTSSALLPICLLAAWGARRLLAHLHAAPVRAALGASAVLLAAGGLTARAYFVEYPNVAGLREKFSSGASEVGMFVRSVPVGAPVLVSTRFHPSVVRFVSGRNAGPLAAADPSAMIANPDPRSVYVLDEKDPVPAFLEAPGYLRSVIEAPHGERFVVYTRP